MGNPGEFTIRELAEKVLKLTGSQSQLVEGPLPVDDPRQRRPDISLAGRLLSWEPTMRLDDGLPRTVQYFEHVLATLQEGGRTASAAANSSKL